MLNSLQKTIGKEILIVTILIVGLLGLYSLDRARLGHSIPDEKRYIQSTKEMVVNGDYITPRYHGRLRFQKPILFYWLILLSYKAFGIGIFGARFPSIVAALLNVILIYLLGRDLFNKKAALFSAFVLSTCEVYFMYSRFASPDMTFIFFITASIYLFIKAYRGDIKGNFKYLYMYIPMALAMLTKGPLGFLYPMLTVCLFLILRRDWRIFKELKFLPGLLLFAAISAPWFIIMILRHGNEYFDKVWSLEIIKKLKYSPSAGENLLIHYVRAALYYAGMTFARHLPWSLFLPASLIAVPGLRREKEKKDYGFTLIAAYFFAVFISLVLVWSKESYYVLGLSIPLSLFVGVYFSKITEENNLSKSILFRLPFALAILASFIALIIWTGFLVYILDKPIFSFSILMLTTLVFAAYAYFGKNKILLPLGFFILISASLGYFAGYAMPVIDDESLMKVGNEIKNVIGPGDIVGVASSEVSYHRLNVPLRDHIVIRADKYTVDKRLLGGEREYINDFLSTKDRRIFCVMTKGDYYEFIDDELRDRLYIMNKTFIWKRFHKQDEEYFKGLFSYLLENKRGLIKQALKEEIYLITNSAK